MSSYPCITRCLELIRSAVRALSTSSSPLLGTRLTEGVSTAVCLLRISGQALANDTLQLISWFLLHDTGSLSEIDLVPRRWLPRFRSTFIILDQNRSKCFMEESFSCTVCPHYPFFITVVVLSAHSDEISGFDGQFILEFSFVRAGDLVNDRTSLRLECDSGICRSIRDVKRYEIAMQPKPCM